jgi:diaminopropionate ammonia-lyase
MARTLVNPLRDPDASGDPAPVGEPLAFHRRLPGYGPTPLVEAPGPAAELGLAALWVKDESSRLGLPAFKVLGASWATFRALAARFGEPPDDWVDLDDLVAWIAPHLPLSLVAATDGNHGRAVARMASLLGLGARILVPAGTAEARIAAIASEGARVDVVDGTYDDAVLAAAALATDRAFVVSDTSWPGYRDVPTDVIRGYDTIFSEVDDELARRRAPQPDVIVVQSGVGALAAAAVAHHRTGAGGTGGGPRILVVEPDDADCALRSAEAGTPTEVPGPHRSIMAGLNCGNVSPLAWPALAAGVDAFVTVTDPDAEQAMRDLAALGVVAGETGGSGLAGLRVAVDAGLVPAGSHVLVICTEGATDPANHDRIVHGAAGAAGAGARAPDDHR